MIMRTFLYRDRKRDNNGKLIGQLRKHPGACTIVDINSPAMITAFYLLAGMAIIQGIVSLAEGLKYFRYIKQSLSSLLNEYLPAVTLIVPCKGVDESFEKNLSALLAQDYPKYSTILVTESEQDPAYLALEEKRQQTEVCWTNTRLIVAGKSCDRGQKVHNLLAAIDQIDPESEVLVFADSDGRPRYDWLRHLVAPLADNEVGATTGYRWYLPVEGSFASVLRSTWNGSVATALGGHKRNFAWGGSMAIRRKTFDEANVREYWQGALSDDYALTRAVNDSGKYVRFVPQCMIISEDDCSFREMLEFTTRQIIITRVYSSGLWKIALLSNALFAVSFFGGLLIMLLNLIYGRDFAITALPVGLIYLLGAGKGWLRMRAMETIMPEHRKRIRRYWWAYCLLFPVVSLLFLYNLIVSATTRRISWRGICYELKSPGETVVLKDGKQKAARRKQ